MYYSSFPLKELSLDSDLNQGSLLEYYTDSVKIHDLLFSALKKDALMVQPNPFRNRLIFYWAHPFGFMVRKLFLSGLLKEPVGGDLDLLFEKGVSPDKGQSIADLQDKFPDLETVSNYIDNCKEVINLTLKKFPGGKISYDSAWYSAVMGIEHLIIHLQTSLCLFRELSLDLKQLPGDWNYGPLLNNKYSSSKEFVNVPVFRVNYGVSENSQSNYYWDNEFGQVNILVPEFEVSKGPVSNLDYLEFVQTGVYEDLNFWSKYELGKEWFEQNRYKAPASWYIVNNNEYKYKTPFAVFDMPWHAPVEVCALEAMAYADWKKMSLMSESQFHSIKQQNIIFIDDGFGRWIDGEFKPLDNACFEKKIHNLYFDFSKPWFNNKHRLILGNPWSASGHMRNQAFRDFMQVVMPQFTTIQLIKKI